MPATEYLRLSMQLDLRRTQVDAAQLPDGFHWVSWKPVLLERHAAVKWRSFRGESDSEIFPCLGEAQGCRRLMRLITGHACFCPEATWMVSYHPDKEWPADDCATIQAVVRGGRTGAIQNVGVVSSYRGMGIGRALMTKSLAGLQSLGLANAVLEVTADNRPAVNLYKSLGFRVVREFTRKREVTSPQSPPVASPSPLLKRQ
jgi:GNAT superfamily N-acetyltransferase